MPPILSDFFASTGNGSDLTIHIQDATGVSSFVVADETVAAAGTNFIRWDVPNAFEAVLARIGSGDLFIFAFTRESAAAALNVGGTATLPSLTAEGGVSLSDIAPLTVGGYGHDARACQQAAG